MRAIIILSLSALFTWYLITRFEPGDGTIILNDSTMKQMHRDLVTIKILWVILMVLQAVILFRLYKVIPKIKGIEKNGAIVYFGFVFLTLLLSFIIVFIAATSFWF
jgi:hypothetical protein